MKVPSFPRMDTLRARALARLLSGQSLTHRSFDSETRTYRLSAAIHELRQEGWAIETLIEEAPTADPVGRTARFGRYLLPLAFIQSAGAEGQAWAAKVKAWEQSRPAERQAGSIALGLLQSLGLCLLAWGTFHLLGVL